jgi:IclR family transcriptional regulator, acetate operon repressor
MSDGHKFHALDHVRRRQRVCGQPDTTLPIPQLDSGVAYIVISSCRKSSGFIPMNETNAVLSSADRSPVLKALRLLAHIAGSPEAPALAELSRAMKLPKPTTYRLARSLENVGFVRKDPLTLRYQIGTSFESIALNGLRNSAAHGSRRLLMSELAERLGARVNLVVLKSGNLSFVQWVESTAPLRVDINGDMPMPVHCSASGKLLLAFSPPELRAAVMRSAPFQSYTKNTITAARAMARHLEDIRNRGYSVDDQELIPGVNCLAVPVLNHVGQTVAGLAVMAPVASLPLEKLKRHLPGIKACAAAISAELGWEEAANGTRAPHKPKKTQLASRRQRSAT